MKNTTIRSKKFSMYLIICLSICMLACSKAENAKSENEIFFDEKIPKQEAEIQVGQGKQISYNYDGYLYKIWMPEEWGTDANLIHDTGFSISIYKIEDNTFVWKPEITEVREEENIDRSYDSFLDFPYAEMSFANEDAYAYIKRV